MCGVLCGGRCGLGRRSLADTWMAGSLAVGLVAVGQHVQRQCTGHSWGKEVIRRHRDSGSPTLVTGLILLSKAEGT